MDQQGQLGGPGGPAEGSGGHGGAARPVGGIMGKWVNRLYIDIICLYILYSCT